MKTSDSFRVIRVSGDCEAIIVVSPENGTGQPESSYFLHNTCIQEPEEPFFADITETAAMAYFAGIADGMGWVNPPEETFQSLVAVEKWAIKTGKKYKQMSELKVLTSYFALVQVGPKTATRKNSNLFLKSVVGQTAGLLVFKRILESTLTNKFNGVRALKLFEQSPAVLKNQRLKGRVSRKVAELQKK